jgi:hypothetical protein
MTETRSWPLISAVGHGVLVHHLSDTHWGYRSWSFAEGEHLLRDLNEGLVPIPDIMIHTGDITDDGTPDQDGYALSWFDRATSSRLLMCMGNHDIRDRPVHTRQSWEGVYGQRANTFMDVKGVRFITFAPDDFTGYDSPWIVPPETWDWVAATAGAHNGPVVLADHYPPSELGVSLGNALQPPAALNVLVGDVPNIVGMLTGHMHKDLTDLSSAMFLTIGGRQLPVLCDISAMLSLEGELGRDQSAKIQSTTAYVEILPEAWRVHYRRHGSHAWGGPGDQRVTTLNLDTATVTRGM